MAFNDTLQKFLKRNTKLAVVRESPSAKKAKELGIDITSLDEKDISYVLEQYRLELRLF